MWGFFRRATRSSLARPCAAGESKQPHARAGWQAADQFDEIFELAEPGKAFEVYSYARFTPVR
jgi:hypothetical protein